MTPLPDARRRIIWVAITLIVLLIELGATIGTATGAPFSPVAGWGPTRPADALGFAVVALGCLALPLFGRFPITVAMISTGSYLIFAFRDYELGLFLPPMVVIFALVAWKGRHVAAILCSVASLGAALVWVARRTVTIEEPGASLLAWVAFGTVLGVFFVAPILVGEIVRLRSPVQVLARSLLADS